MVCDRRSIALRCGRTISGLAVEGAKGDVSCDANRTLLDFDTLRAFDELECRFRTPRTAAVVKDEEVNIARFIKDQQATVSNAYADPKVTRLPLRQSIWLA
jgi:hypothetical protein